MDLFEFFQNFEGRTEVKFLGTTSNCRIVSLVENIFTVEINPLRDRPIEIKIKQVKNFGDCYGNVLTLNNGGIELLETPINIVADKPIKDKDILEVLRKYATGSGLKLTYKIDRIILSYNNQPGNITEDCMVNKIINKFNYRAGNYNYFLYEGEGLKLIIDYKDPSKIIAKLKNSIELVINLTDDLNSVQTVELKNRHRSISELRLSINSNTDADIVDFLMILHINVTIVDFENPYLTLKVNFSNREEYGELSLFNKYLSSGELLYYMENEI